MYSSHNLPVQNLPQYDHIALWSYRLIFWCKTLEHGGIMLESKFFAWIWLKEADPFFSLYLVTKIYRRAWLTEFVIFLPCIWHTKDPMIDLMSPDIPSECDKFRNALWNSGFFLRSLNGFIFPFLLNEDV